MIERVENLDHSYPQELKLTANWPHRSPFVIGQVIRPIIEDKIVCDVGCAEGDQLKIFAQFAKHVIGVEINSIRAKPAINAGFNVIQGDYKDIDLPQADVYFSWIGIQQDQNFVDYLFQNQIKCTTLNFSRRAPHTLELAKKYNGKILEFEFHEPSSDLPHFEKDGLGWVSVITI